MKCKICNEEINLIIFGAPEDICYGCLSSEQKNEIVKLNVKELKNEKY
jgi:hypothetical protein